MKNLQEIQQENRRLILEAIHGVSYEEALRKESFFHDCLLQLQDRAIPVRVGEGSVMFYEDFKRELKYQPLNGIGEFFESVIGHTTKIHAVIGKPSFLPRVLLALQNKVDYMVFGLNYSHATFDDWWITSSGAAAGIIEMWLCKWDLTKETLEEQSEETQRAINKLLTQ